MNVLKFDNIIFNNIHDLNKFLDIILNIIELKTYDSPINWVDLNPFYVIDENLVFKTTISYCNRTKNTNDINLLEQYINLVSNNQDLLLNFINNSNLIPCYKTSTLISQSNLESIIKLIEYIEKLNEFNLNNDQITSLENIQQLPHINFSIKVNTFSIKNVGKSLFIKSSLINSKIIDLFDIDVNKLKEYPIIKLLFLLDKQNDPFKRAYTNYRLKLLRVI